MSHYLLMFTRNNEDEVLPANATSHQRFEQLVLEFEGSFDLQFISRRVDHVSGEDQIFCTTEWPVGPEAEKALVVNLQESYDDLAIDGNFHIIGVVEKAQGLSLDS